MGLTNVHELEINLKLAVVAHISIKHEIVGPAFVNTGLQPRDFRFFK